MIKFPVVNQGVTLQEIPGKIAVFFEIGNCRRRCKGCHSAEYMWTKLHRDLWTPLDDMVAYADKHVKLGAEVILLMGGTMNDGVSHASLMTAVNKLSEIAPVGIYSGADDTAYIHTLLKYGTPLRYLKTGKYIKKLGGLSSPTTNQRFYEYDTVIGGWCDRTYLFQPKTD